MSERVLQLEAQLRLYQAEEERLLEDRRRDREEIDTLKRRVEYFRQSRDGALLVIDETERERVAALAALRDAECGDVGTHGDNLDPACRACVALCRLRFVTPSPGIRALLEKSVD